MKVLLFFLFAIGVLSPGGLLYAEDVPRGITVSPAFQEITLGQEDARADFSVSVTNTMEEAVTLRITVFDFGSLDESGGVAFLGASNDLEKKYALASWIRPEKDVFMIEPNETKQILVTIENREALSPGGHYGALTFKTEYSVVGDRQEGNTLSVNQLFSTLVFVKKVGGEIYDLKLSGQEYKGGLMKFQDTVRLRFRNNGNTHAVPRGMAVVSDSFGRKVAKGIINQESGLILPETFRVYPVHLNPLAMSFIPGRYTMEIAYRYDGKDDFATTTFFFYHIPWPALLASILFIALLWAAGRICKRTYGTRNQ